MRYQFTLVLTLTLATTSSSNLFADLTPAATYLFRGSLNAEQGAVPALSAVDPSGVAGFVSDAVLGNARTVYNFGGATTPNLQGGLAFNSTGLIAANNYSVELVFEFSTGTNAWRRILDVADRSTDSGFYIDPTNNLDIYPVSGGSGLFTTSAYHSVVLTVAPGSNAVVAYLDGTQAFSTTSTVMDITSATNLVNLFLDNTSGGGLGEYSPGHIALFRVYAGVLGSGQVSTLAANPFASAAVPEPSSLFLMCSAGIALVGLRQFRRAISRQAAASRARTAGASSASGFSAR